MRFEIFAQNLEVIPTFRRASTMVRQEYTTCTTARMKMKMWSCSMSVVVRNGSWPCENSVHIITQCC